MSTTQIPLTTMTQVVLSFTPMTKRNNPVQNPSYVTGTKPTWSGGAGSVSLFPSADGMTCIAAGIAAGSGSINAVAQMNSTAGVVAVPGIPVTYAVTVDIRENNPTHLQITAGAVTDQ